MSRQVIRQDVIEITTKAPTTEIDRLTRSFDKFGNTATKTENVGKIFGSWSEELGNFGESLKGTNLGSFFSKASSLATGSAGVIVETAEQVAEKLSEVGNKILETFKKIASFSFKAVLAGLTAITAGIVKITKSAVDAYADYEQNVGGVETLFKKSAGKLIKNAQKAYRTAGLSANEYMENAVMFSASLLQSLNGDTEKASEYTDRAMRDMSDNANKFGTDITSIQNAYQSFARGQYGMLDNLRLGYGGTKSEMQRLIKDASKMTKEQKKLNVVVDGSSTSFGNLVNAISVVQKHLKVTGTTSKEAKTTITGSLNAVKASWDNLLVSFASGKGLNKATDHFMSSVETFIKNVYPVAKRALTNVVQKLKTELPKIIAKVPQGLTGVISDIYEAIVGTPLSGSSQQSLQNLFKDIFSIGADLGRTAIELAVKAAPYIKKLADEIHNFLANTSIDQIWEMIKAFLRLGKILADLTNPLNLVIDLIGSIIELANTISNIVFPNLQASINNANAYASSQSTSSATDSISQKASKGSKTSRAEEALSGVVKHAKGGLITRPHVGLVGEAGSEMIIPLTNRRRGLQLYNQTGAILGANNSSNTTTYAPVFNLSISGSNDDKILARKVKRWIRESINDMQESMEYQVV